MGGFLVKNRQLVVDGEQYCYSVKEGPEAIELLIYHGKHPLVRLRQSWEESWGIELCRPGVAALVVRYFRENPPGEPRLLREEKELLFRLADLCFPPEEAAAKARFLAGCAEGVPKTTP